MPNFWKLVNDVISRSDVLLIVLDARFIDETMNAEIKEKIERAGKDIIYVINKSDLVNKKRLDNVKQQFRNCVFMSAKKHQGTNLLRTEILTLSKGEGVVVGVLGYPNTGKSSVINSLSGGAKVAPISGYTKAIQIIRVSSKIKMIDTPGVIPFQEKDETKHLLIGSMNPIKAKDPDLAAEILIKNNRPKVFEWYGVELDEGKSDEEILSDIAIKLNYLMKGSEPDIKRAAIKILNH